MYKASNQEMIYAWTEASFSSTGELGYFDIFSGIQIQLHIRTSDGTKLYKYGFINQHGYS